MKVSQWRVPYVFLANGREIRFWESEREAYVHTVKTFFKQTDLERRFATRQLQQDILAVPIDLHIAGRDYQLECIETLCPNTTGTLTSWAKAASSWKNPGRNISRADC